MSTGVGGFNFAHELHSHGVAVVAIYPGLMRTEYLNHPSPAGCVLVAAELAHEHGIADIDG